ncbi:MAG: PIN domain-containing protein [Synergistaceae bacterium]|nr:PIN domain-containing protein [Synergistaceae bacterium]
MRLLIDSNILLDVMQSRREYYMSSYAVWMFCEKGYVDGYISALTFANIVYIMRKQLRYDEIDKVLWNLKNAFYFIDLTLSDFETAASMKWRDFEDAIQASTAERINADYIITRNTKDFEGSKVKALTPEEYFTDIFSVNE